MATPVKVKKWGSSMAVLIPRQVAKKKRIEVGAIVDIESLRVVKPQRRRYTLAELMSQFRPKHRHGEWDLGGAVGKELW